MTDGLKVRLRCATPTAMMAGEEIDVVMPRSMIPLNPYLVAELVEDHPTFIRSADIDADLGDDALEAMLGDAIEHTIREHQFRSGAVRVDLDDAEKAEILAIMGPSPWTTAMALALASGWCPRDELAGTPLRIAIPARSVVFYVSEAAAHADPRLAAALERLASEAYDQAGDREALFPGTFVATDGRLQPTRDHGPAPTLEMDGASMTPIAAEAPAHVTMRRVIAAMVEALHLSESEVAGGLVELAAQSLDADADFGGEHFLPAMAIVLERAAPSFPEWLRPAALAIARALTSGAEPALRDAVHLTMAAIDTHCGRRLADIEAQMAGLDPWFCAAPVLDPAELAKVGDDDLAAFIHRVGWLAVAELRPHLGADVDHDLTELGARGVLDGTDTWIDMVPAALALLEKHIECCAAVRIACARLSTSLTLVHRGLRLGVDPDSTRRMLAELISTWQWVRGVISTSPPTTPITWPADASLDAQRLVAQWGERGGATWVVEWRRIVARLAEQLVEPTDADAPSSAARKEHLDAAAAVVAALRVDCPPEAADAAETLARKVDALAFASDLCAEARGDARFLDGETPDELLGPDVSSIADMVLAAFWLAGGSKPNPAQAQVAADFLAARSTATLARIHDLCASDEPLAAELLRTWSQLDDDSVGRMLLMLVRGSTELKRCADGGPTRDALRAALGDIAGQAKSWWGLRSGPGRKDRNRLEFVLSVLDS